MVFAVLLICMCVLQAISLSILLQKAEQVSSALLYAIQHSTADVTAPQAFVEASQLRLRLH